MRIDLNNKSTYNTNFKAKHLSQVMTKVAEKVQTVDLYALDLKDKKFAENLLKKINLNELYPEVTDKNGFKYWTSLIHYAVKAIGKREVVLAVRDKRPCGIMAYESDENRGIHLSYLAKWRTKPFDDTNHMGKIFMHFLLNKAQDLKAKHITLSPLRVSPRGKPCETFYESIGFYKDDPQMVLPDFMFAQRKAQLENFLTNVTCGKGNYINANRKFKLTFKETLGENITKKFDSLSKNFKKNLLNFFKD